MKRSLVAALAFASIAAVSVSGLGTTSAQAATTSSAFSATVSASATSDVSALRQQFNDYVASHDFDADTRASLEAAGASDVSFSAAAKVSVTKLQNLLTTAGVDRDAYGSPALNPGDYECGPTALNRWASAQVAQIDPTSWSWYNNGFLGMSPDLLVQYWTLMKTPKAPHDTSFGVDGSETNEVSRTFRALQNFWDIDGSGIGIVAYNGKVLADTPDARAERQFVYDGLGKVSALGSILLELGVEGGIMAGDLGGFPGGVDNPMFSLNSFAIDPTHETGDDKEMLDTLGITRRVAMGDGLMLMWKDLGLSRAADRAVLAHEYGHQVQYTDNLFETTITDPAEATARTELMADAFGTYFTVSKHGESLNKAQALQDLQAFYTVGDCAFDNPGHHGTPNQRYRAAQWGADLAKAQDNQGHVMPSLEVDAAFEKALPEITAPDAN